MPLVCAQLWGVERLPSILGAILSVSALANLAGSPLAGAIKQNFGWSALLMFCASITAIAAVFSILLRLKQDRRLFKKL
jgi:predicted MFS family arabinose efflux permease